jgi:hypothetical protein
VAEAASCDFVVFILSCSDVNSVAYLAYATGPDTCPALGTPILAGRGISTVAKRYANQPRYQNLASA